jgi:hypothetical protein
VDISESLLPARLDPSWRDINADNVVAPIAKPKHESSGAATHIQNAAPHERQCFELDLSPFVELGEIEAGAGTDSEVAVVVFDDFVSAPVAQVVEHHLAIRVLLWLQHDETTLSRISDIKPGPAS